MEPTEPKIPQSELNLQEKLPPLPFNYQRTIEKDKAEFVETRFPLVSVVGQEDKPRTDQKILESVRKEREGRDWFLDEEWRRKGQPAEQIELKIGTNEVTIYNFNSEKLVTDTHLQKCRSVFEEFSSRFPKLLPKFRWILIDNRQLPSYFGDPEKYPTNGDAFRNWQTIRLYPRAMDFSPHRIETTTNFEGTLTHELAHLGEVEFAFDWFKSFRWDYCFENLDDWELRETKTEGGDGLKKRFHNKQTGEMSPQGMFALQPDQCVNGYAKQTPYEDLAESMVAYLFDPELLKTVSSKKFAILEKHDVHGSKPEVKTKRIPKDQIKLPEIKPETVYFYIEEPVSR